VSVSSEVSRTLVKSPPELWAELSDPSTLARHLGELGEIRITGTDPERLVDWEATGTDGTGVSGRVEIEPSGWGTRVTLSASRAVVEPEPATIPEQMPEPEPETSGSEVGTVTIEAIEPEQTPGPEPEPEAIEVIPEVEPAPASGQEIVEPEPRPGFFARLFRLFRRRKQQFAPEPTAEPGPDPGPVAVVEIEEQTPVEIVAETPVREESAPEEPASEAAGPGQPAPEQATPATPETDIAAELAELEQQTEAVLTGVLDRLGAAHHRPFSRA
jgi:hypothetical protein